MTYTGPTPSEGGWMPGVDRETSPNFSPGRGGLGIQAGVIHIMQGGFEGSVDWLTNGKSGVSSNFAVSKTGKKKQMVSIHDTAQANGLSWDPVHRRWIDPEDNVVQPSWKRLQAPINPNRVTFSIEHEGNTGDIWTPEEYAADAEILRWVATQVPIVYTAHDTLIGHFEISPKARAHCPGTGFDFAHLVDLVNAVPGAAGGLTFRTQPRISEATFTNILLRFNSPVAPQAHAAYDVIVKAGLDPAVALAFFGKESTFGTRGVSVETKNWGNVRQAFKPERAIGQHPRNFAIYPDWLTGLVDWCDRINVRYIQEKGLDTVEKAVPVYAPAFDNNVPLEYIDWIKKHVADWMAEDDNASPVVAQPQLTYVKIVNDAGANIRQGPGTTFPIAAKLQKGAIIGLDGYTKGQAIGGVNMWGHYATGEGFLHPSLFVVLS